MQSVTNWPVSNSREHMSKHRKKRTIKDIRLMKETNQITTEQHPHQYQQEIEHRALRFQRSRMAHATTIGRQANARNSSQVPTNAPTTIQRFHLDGRSRDPKEDSLENDQAAHPQKKDEENRRDHKEVTVPNDLTALEEPFQKTKDSPPKTK